jgi:hypothetical protein
VLPFQETSKKKRACPLLLAFLRISGEEVGTVSGASPEFKIGLLTITLRR